jgi:hypothetical protein
VYVVADCPIVGRITASGTIIAKNAVITVAHSVYCRKNNRTDEAKKV